MTTYYVATNGSNSGKGTSGSPWQHDQQGDDRPTSSPATRWWFAPAPTRRGFIGKDGITLRSEVPGGAKIVPPSGKIGINIGADHVTVKGFEVSGSTTCGIVGNGVHHVKVLDNIVHDNKSQRHPVDEVGLHHRRWQCRL